MSEKFRLRTAERSESGRTVTEFVNRGNPARLADPAWRPDFERWLDLQGGRAQLVIRFGTGPQMPFSIRRPPDDVIVSIEPRQEGNAGVEEMPLGCEWIGGDRAR